MAGPVHYRKAGSAGGRKVGFETALDCHRRPCVLLYPAANSARRTAYGRGNVLGKRSIAG